MEKIHQKCPKQFPQKTWQYIPLGKGETDTFSLVNANVITKQSTAGEREQEIQRHARGEDPPHLQKEVPRHLTGCR